VMTAHRAVATTAAAVSDSGLKLARCPLSLAATLGGFTLITRTAPCSRQLP
jgi:hypothetical protein